MTNVQTATAAIRKMSNEELNQIVAEIKLRRTFLTRRIAANICVGDTVSFTGRRNMVVVGKVTKVNTKTVLVEQRNSLTVWRVHASLLKKVDTVS